MKRWRKEETQMKSKKFNTVKQFYDGGLWGESRVRAAVVKGWITEDEFFEITGTSFDEQEVGTL